jgi:hypothetical protein
MQNVRNNSLRARGLALACAAIILALPAVSAHAGKIVLRITAANPINEVQKKTIMFDLPPFVGTNDIMSLGGLDLGYDIKKDVYYVHKEVELGPKQITVYEVEINDIWSISKEEIEALRKQAAALVARLNGLKDHDLAEALGQEADKNLVQVELSQAENAIKPGVKAIQHIRAYETDVLVIKKVKKSIRRIENLVLGAGMDPGSLVDDGRNTELAHRDADLPSDQYGVAIDRIIVKNTSPTFTRKVPIRRELPPEIKAADILDSAGLEIGIDPKNGLCFVYKDDLEVGPATNVIFNVKIRDKWNVNAPRIPVLKASASNVLDRIAAKAKFASVEQTLKTLMGDLDQMALEQGPKELNEKYVAFYRNQAERLDVIEQKIARIEAALRPIEKTTKLGFGGKAPTMKTTWMIIYIILGFLAVMSLLFFLRWFGKSKSETMDSSQPTETK